MRMQQLRRQSHVDAAGRQAAVLLEAAEGAALLRQPDTLRTAQRSRPLPL